MSLTYQDLIDQYQSEIDAAEKNSQPEIICEKLVALSDTYLQLGFDAMESFNYSEGYSSFNEAFLRSQYFQQYFDLIPEETQPADLRKRNDQNYYFSMAFANFCLGQFNNSNRNPGSAVVYFEKAKSDFEHLSKVTGKLIWSIFSKYCGAFKMYAEGMEDFYRTSFGNAKNKLQRSMISLGNLIEKEIPGLKDEFPEDENFYSTTLSRFKSDYQAIRSYYYLSDAKHQFNNRNFKSAARQFATVAKEFDHSIKNYGDAITEPMKNITIGEFHNYSGWQLLAEAEDCRDEEKWDECLMRYDRAREEWEQASNYYLLSGLPMGVTLQEIISNTAQTLDNYQQVYEKERSLKERINELERSNEELTSRLFTAIKSGGVTVNTTQEVVTTVEQNAQLIQNIENNVREGLDELLKAIETSQLETGLKKELEKKTSELANSNEKGSKFLGKVKSFTKDLADIVKNVGDIAQPLIPGYKLLRMLL